MQMIKLMEKRKSCRDYKNKKLKREDVNKVNDFISSYTLNDYKDLDVVVEYDGDMIYNKLNGISGYNGVMVKAPQYIIIYSLKKDEEYRKAGFVGEKLIVSMLGENIDSCWIDVNNPEMATEALGRKHDKEIVALIAFGYSSERTFVNRIFKTAKGSASDVKKRGYRDNNFDVSVSSSDRNVTTDYIYVDKWGKEITPSELSRRGLDNVYHYIQYAPSHGNRQPWKFIICSGEMVITIRKNENIVNRSENLEGGIAMFYLYIAMTESGYSGDWNYSDSENKYDVPDDYRIIGKFIVRS